jgi:hypothetical protein
MAFGIGLAYLLSVIGASGGGSILLLTFFRMSSSMAYVTNRNHTSRTFSCLEGIASIPTNSYACIIMSDNRCYKLSSRNCIYRNIDEDRVHCSLGKLGGSGRSCYCI